MPWAVIASLALHALFLPLGVWLAALQFHLPQSVPPRELVIASTAVSIERRPRPQPRHPRELTAPAKIRVRQPVPRRTASPRRVTARREVARLEPRATPQPTATPQPRPGTLTQALAAQQRQFERTVRQLRGDRNPLSVATIAPSPSTAQRSLLDVPGRRYRERAMAILFPIKHWTASGLSCYYTRYTTQFSGGGSEEGMIPWPVCYPIGNDRMLPINVPHALPVPLPPPGYQLPPNTYLTPFLQSIYNARGQ